MDPTTLLSAPASDRLTLKQLSKENNVSPVTCWRWTLRGVDGLRLPSIKIGNKRVTTRSMFNEWCRQLTENANGAAVPVTAADAHRDNAIDHAEQEADQLLGTAPCLKKEDDTR